jgi:16S rRNA (guanine527-N7)-methyltransferase
MKNLLTECLLKLNISLNYIFFEPLLNYWEKLIFFNSHLNLISRKQSLENSFINHIVDSLTALMLPWPAELGYMDIGSGGGLPAIPLKIVNPGWDALLVESTKNKAAALRRLGVDLNLNKFSVLNSYIDKKNKSPNLNFSLITTRGLASINLTVPLVSPYLSQGGHFLAYKGPNGFAELDEAKSNLKRHGMKLSELKEFKLPIIDSSRILLLFIKF